MCSTPFGDIDECTIPRAIDNRCIIPAPFIQLRELQERDLSASAQRLSATLMNARHPLDGRPASLEEKVSACSTPFGDIDECTLVVTRATGRAKREQPVAASACSTPFGDIDECTDASGCTIRPVAEDDERRSIE